MEGRKSAFKDYLQQCSNTSAEQAPVSTSVCEPTARLWPWSLTKLLPPAKTLSDWRLLNSLLLSEKKTFPTPPSSLPIPKRLQELDHLVLSFSSPPSADGAMSLEHFEKEKKRGEAERNEGGNVYRNIVTKKENCS